MRKFYAVFLMVILLLSCCACNDSQGKKTVESSKKQASIKDSAVNSDDSIDDNDYIDEKEFDDSNDDFGYDYGESQQANNSAELAVVKERIPVDAVQFNGDYDNYYSVLPKVEHPGVVNMDATYYMQVTDYAQKRIKADEVLFTANLSDVEIIGNTVVVPYSVRKGYKPLIITVTNKSDSKKKGSYKFDFAKFTDNKTFYDDFSSDNGTWGEDPYSPGKAFGVIKDGCMEMTLTENRQLIRTSANNFKQAYGCFSARMKMPSNKSNICGAFWMFTGAGYIPNPESAADSAGEIDVVEFITGGNKALFTVHWFSYGGFHKENGSRQPFSYDPNKFMTFSVVWTPQNIFWYVDGELYKYATGTEEGVANGSSPMYLILQAYYIGKSVEFGFSEEDILPATVYVDWVEVYGLEFD